MRARLVGSSTLGNTKSFDKDGEEVSTGMTLKATGGAFVLEYGVLKHLSLQLVQKYVESATWELDESKFQSSTVYSAKAAENLNYLKPKLAAIIANDQNLSQERATQIVEDFVSNNTSIKDIFSQLGITEASQANTVLKAQGVTLSSGEDVPVEKYWEDSLSDAVKSLVTSGAKGSSTDFRLGDLEVGALYSIFNNENEILDGKLHFSVGLGLRFPVGESLTPRAILPAGGGTIDLGFRTNLDYYPMDHLVLSWQNQAEVMLKEGKVRETSLLDNTKFVDSSLEKGEELSNKKTGLANIGFVKMGWSMGMISPSLNSLGVSAYYHYAFDRDVEGLDVSSSSPIQTGGGHLHSWELMTNFNGLNFGVPVQLELSYKAPISGKNQTMTSDALAAQIKFFYRF